MMRRTGQIRGTTLVEVIAAMVILGTLIASLAAARGRFQTQWGDARRRLEAGRALDRLVSDWLNGPASGIPLNASGSLDFSRGCSWFTQTLMPPDATSLGCVVVHVWVQGDSVKAPLAQVDLLVRPQPTPGAK